MNPWLPENHCFSHAAPGGVDEDVVGVVRVEPPERDDLQEGPPEGGEDRQEVALDKDLPPRYEDDLVHVDQHVGPCIRVRVRDRVRVRGRVRLCVLIGI